MIRKIIKIDQEKCNGCSLCVNACHEGAIGMVEGKATLLRDDYCDGLGNCLPACPTGAITFEEREALEYNQAEVDKNMAGKNPLPCGKPVGLEHERRACLFHVAAEIVDIGKLLVRSRWNTRCLHYFLCKGLRGFEPRTGFHRSENRESLRLEGIDDA